MKFYKKIPINVRVTTRTKYEVLYVDAFPVEEQVGECRLDGNTKQILIKRGLSEKETFKTFIHELLHALSFSTPDLNLTENQVLKLEEAIERVLRLNKWI